MLCSYIPVYSWIYNLYYTIGYLSIFTYIVDAQGDDTDQQIFIRI